RPELLHAAPVDRLTGVQVALGVDGDGMEEGEVARVVTRHAEPGEDVLGPGAALHGGAGRRLPRERQLPVEGPDDLVAAVDLEHEALLAVERELDVPGRARRAERHGRLAIGLAGGDAGSGDDGDYLERLAHRRGSRHPDGRVAR